MVKILTNQKDFNDLINKEITIIDFHASWCPPCHKIKPIFEDLSKQYLNINFGSIDIDLKEL